MERISIEKYKYNYGTEILCWGEYSARAAVKYSPFPTNLPFVLLKFLVTVFFRGKISLNYVARKKVQTLVWIQK